MNTLYLTPDERRAFEQLPEDVRDGWQVADETLDAYETDRQLYMRASLSTMHKYPVVQEMVSKVHEGQAPDTITLGEIPEDAMSDFYFTIGARGVSKLMAYALRLVKTDEDMDGLASFSFIRHKLLELNASAPSSVSSH